MKLKSKILKFLAMLVSVKSGDPDTATTEYMTKMLLIVLSLVTIPFTLLSAIAWLYEIIPTDTVLLLIFMSVLFITGLWLAHMEYWRLSSLIPPGFMLLTAVYGNYVGGIDAPAMLLYVLAITFIAVLRGPRDMYVSLFISVILFLSMGIAHRYGFITQIRTGRTVFWNRVIIAVAAMISIASLVHFLIKQLRNVLQQARAEIKERKIVETALRESEKNYRELVQNVNSIILRMNINGEVTFINEYAEHFFGYSKNEIIGKNVIGTIVPGKDLSGNDLKVMINSILEKPDDFRFNENENMTRDGKRVWITWANKSIRDSNDHIIEILSVGYDITEKKMAMEEKEKMQVQLIQAQKMEAIGTLTSGLAHDFNNMLGGITGSISLLEIFLENENISDKEKVKNYIRIALDSSRKASDMIRQLLLLSRKQEIKLNPVDINKSVENVVRLCRNSFPKSILFNVAYDKKPMMVMGDSSLIEQIFLNFCVNASHAMTIMRNGGKGEGGNITIRITSTKETQDYENPAHTTEIKPGYILTEISDTGVGMSNEIKERIYEPFFTMKKKEAGSGLGLSMAYSLISQLGGYIETDSEPGRGSTFRIFMPEMAGSAVPAKNKTPGKTLVSGNGDILIIDDEIPVLTIAEEILNACGYKIFKATDGIEGLSIYEKNKDSINAVLLDISLPYMSGLDVYKKLKKINPEVIVLLSSGFSDDDRIIEAMSLGAAGFIQKPYTAEELSQKINELLVPAD